MRSRGFDGGVRVLVVPVEDVSVMPEITTLKLRREGLAGSVSATRVKLTVAVPPPQLVMHGPVRTPLQEASRKIDAKATDSDNFVKFIEHPKAQGRVAPVQEPDDPRSAYDVRVHALSIDAGKAVNVEICLELGCGVQDSSGPERRSPARSAFGGVVSALAHFSGDELRRIRAGLE